MTRKLGTGTGEDEEAINGVPTPVEAFSRLIGGLGGDLKSKMVERSILKMDGISVHLEESALCKTDMMITRVSSCEMLPKARHGP